jgi:hypothetical protein
MRHKELGEAIFPLTRSASEGEAGQTLHLLPGDRRRPDPSPGANKLEVLRLTNTRVTDAGLVHLQGLTKLEWLHLNNTQVSEQGARELNKVLPNTTIRR